MIQVATGETVDGGKPTIAERIKAAEWLGRKIVPDVKERPINFTVGDINGPSDAVSAIGSVIQALSSGCLLYTSPSPRDKRQSRMPSSA